jgi:hypothetical protein
MASADFVANAVGAYAGGASKFTGWLADPDGPNLRLYTGPRFQEWLEFAADAVLAQVQNSPHCPPGGSIVWVKRDAVVTRCQTSSAYRFEDLVEGASSDDPAAARWPPHP